MTTTITICIVVLLLPVIVLLWATESRSTRIKRMKRNGWTNKRIAQRYSVSPSTVGRWLKAA